MADDVLIVDDNLDVRTLLVDSLTLLGVKSRQAANGVEALKIIAEDPPKAIILDLMMPVMDGFTTLARLQGKKETKEIPIILLSAIADRAPEVEKLPGVVGVMNKGRYSLQGIRELLTKAGIEDIAELTPHVAA